MVRKQKETIFMSFLSIYSFKSKRKPDFIYTISSSITLKNDLISNWNIQADVFCNNSRSLTYILPWELFFKAELE